MKRWLVRILAALLLLGVLGATSGEKGSCLSSSKDEPQSVESNFEYKP